MQPFIFFTSLTDTPDSESAAAENASSYFPLLRSISSERIPFSSSVTDQHLYSHFRKLLQDDAHIVDPAALDSWDFAVATRTTAPLIETNFQFWRTVVDSQTSSVSTIPDHPLLVLCGQKLLESTTPCDDRHALKAEDEVRHNTRALSFDHVFNVSADSPTYTLYADPTDPSFANVYTKWTSEHTNASFRLRYKPGKNAGAKRLTLNGYGVELALKRTDYIVIDDRDAEDARMSKKAEYNSLHPDIQLDEDDQISDVKPLSSSELRDLGVNTASFIMNSHDPLETLRKITQDFPKFSSALAQANATEDFVKEHRANRNHSLRPGANVIWMNGQQLPAREIDPFSLLDIMRQERTLMRNIQRQGLSPLAARNLISHPILTEAQGHDIPQRYDFTDQVEGGGVIVWLNDLEKDKRYSDWPTTVNAYLQRFFPGQLPSVRKNAHTVIFPVDLSDVDDVKMIVENLQNFVKRTVPVRFGIVPLLDSSSNGQVKVFYYIHDTYGLSALMEYLEAISGGKTPAVLDTKLFDAINTKHKARGGRKGLKLTDVLESTEVERRVQGGHHYLKRLSAVSIPPIFANGIAISKDENWMQALSQRLSEDMQPIQQAVFDEVITDKTWIPSIFLNGSMSHRDPLIIPENAEDITMVDLAMLYDRYSEIWEKLKHLEVAETGSQAAVTDIILFADFSTEKGANLALSAAQFAMKHGETRLRLLHWPEQSTQMSPDQEERIVQKMTLRVSDFLGDDSPNITASQRKHIVKELTSALESQPSSTIDFALTEDLYLTLGLRPGDVAVLMNGRLIGPLAEERELSTEDFDTLYYYERKKRLDPVLDAITKINVNDDLPSYLSLARLSSILALSTMSDGSDGIFERPSGPRSQVYTHWNTSNTCISTGVPQTAPLHFVVVLDPGSEVGQQWTPLIYTISKMEGVFMQIFLNPREKLQELPIKRFYRGVSSHVPQFSDDGSITSSGAHFTGIPKDLLLTMKMDVPPSWVVAPKESIYDLDNIKLSSLSGAGNVRASYELESILIEGHSRDTSLGNPPRGAQLVLRTESHKEYAGTIVMANLGYFQFKASPGVYVLELKQGASNHIFSLDSVATTINPPLNGGGSSSQITLSSFKGATVFPRMSRKAGMEHEDVLESTATLTNANIFSKGAEMADGILAKAGLPNRQAQEYVARFATWGQSILGIGPTNDSTVLLSTEKHADINIFSVASGHLYERMLNIMMVSVMRHTDRTVKFWFLEQFLSPSFKTFLPILAEKYGFTFEMVTYQWPHWLRSQQEKQRIIWGYKILFLDVLFPLDLDKVIFVDADQIIRTDLYDLVQHDLEGAPYGFTPMCDSRIEMEGFRFWKQGYWENFLRGKPYHISALYVVDLNRFRRIAAGDRLRQQYHSLSADPNSLSNLDQDLPNHMQHMLPIHSLPQEWLWCETWCSDESLQNAKTIDLCNNPLTKEPKLDRARRQVPEWTVYDNEIAELAKKRRNTKHEVEGVIGGNENLQSPGDTNKYEL